MNYFRGCIDILFRKIPPYLIINSSFNKSNKFYFTHDHINHELFLNEAFNEFRQCSEDEIHNIYQKLNNLLMDRSELDKKKFPSVLNLLIQFGNEVLIESKHEPYCRYSQFLRWRMLSHKLGQDIFTTSYLAYRDVIETKDRNYFAWNSIIKSDNIKLQNLLNNGLADNHFHLKGSAPAFLLSWISLMNRVANRIHEFRKTKIGIKRLEPDLDYGSSFNKIDLYNLVKKAAVIRAFLFSQIMGCDFFDSKDQGAKTNKYNLLQLEKILTDDDELDLQLFDIQRKIDVLKYEFGYKLCTNKLYYGASVDYALPINLITKNKNSNLFLVGERRFLYLMFKGIYKRDPQILQYTNLFYAYLIIKSKFRAELIQINDRVGFKNFSDYQGRKGIFLEKDPILNNAIYQMAITSTLANQKIESLEVRIMPRFTSTELATEIKKIDDIVEKNKFANKSKSIDDIVEKNKYKDKSQCIDDKEKYFYVLHFPKQKDNLSFGNIDLQDKKMIDSIYPRHYKKRIEVKKQSHAIVSLRDSMKPAIKRILGIDACSNEIGCRPEVFAQVFRYLRNHSNRNKHEYILDEIEIPQLGVSYHVGEDFLDVLDGLRAIDEVIKFLNFKHGDRLGHALALGIDVEEWYNVKAKRIILSKQDYLDNIVWMLAKIRKFNIENSQNLVCELDKQYNKFFQEIYLNSFKNPLVDNFPHSTYYDSWKLRGDDPQLYIDGEFKDNIGICYWDRCGINKLYPKDETIRKNKIATYLYYSYHYNPEVKSKGNEQYEFVVTDDYIRVVKAIQKEMQNLVASKGIAIETNPSSNFLIGTFKRYDKHPILNFYNLGLTTDYEKINNCPQLFVSINTDDQGVFDTYLENEYALMAIALEKAKDKEGNRLYNQSMIYDWLDRIRRMGLEQSFRKIK